MDHNLLPGTEIKVIPESVAPNIPKATIYQGDFFSPKKKVLLSSFLPVKKEIPINNNKKLPSWLNVDIIDDVIYFSGTPTKSNTG